MAIEELLAKKKEGIARRWLDAALAAYPEDASAAFGREKDPFANPVGHALRVGIGAATAALLDGGEPEEIGSCLEEVIKIRAIQEFSPSKALYFIVLLKDAIRAELGKEIETSPVAAEWVEQQRRIDRVALAAFDVYVHYREQVYQLRVNEIKRSVSTLVERMGTCGSFTGQDADPNEPPAADSAETGAR